MKQKEPCGCIHDGARWLTECMPHKTEADALHVRAAAEHRGSKNLASASPTEDWLALPASPT